MYTEYIINKIFYTEKNVRNESYEIYDFKSSLEIFQYLSSLFSIYINISPDPTSLIHNRMLIGFAKIIMLLLAFIYIALLLSPLLYV